MAGRILEYLGLRGCDAEKRLAALRPRVRCGVVMWRDRCRWPATPPPAGTQTIDIQLGKLALYRASYGRRDSVIQVVLKKAGYLSVHAMHPAHDLAMNMAQDTAEYAAQNIISDRSTNGPLDIASYGSQDTTADFAQDIIHKPFAFNVHKRHQL